ncbi:hypothetical protein, partial [Butyrivibrio fibrisolvens]
MSKKKLIACILLIILFGIISAVLGYRISDKIHNEQLVQGVQESAHIGDTASDTDNTSDKTADTSNVSVTDDTTS